MVALLLNCFFAQILKIMLNYNFKINKLSNRFSVLQYNSILNLLEYNELKNGIRKLDNCFAAC